MALKEYEVTVDGRHPHKTTMLLSEAEAKRLNAVEVKRGKPAAKKARPAPKNKAVRPAADKAPPTPAPAPAPAPAGGVEDASDPSASE